MARTFRIDVGLNTGGSLVGSWDRDFPTSIIGCSVPQCAEALLFSDTNRIFQQSGAGTYTARFFMGNITLSGGFPEDGVYASINNLPPGITPLTAIPQLTPSHPGGDGGYLFSILALGLGVSGTTPTSNVTIFYTYNTIPTMLQLATEVIGGSVTHPASYGAIKGLFITGTYSLLQFQFTIPNSTGNTKIRQNDQIRITSTNGGIAGISSINIIWINPVTNVVNTILVGSFTAQTDNLLTFDLYSGIPFDQLPPNGSTIIIEVVGNGIQFSGSYTIGSFIFISDSSGIYVITKNKRNDTLYDHNNTLVTEVVNILDLEDDIEDIMVIDPSQLTIQGLPEEESINNDLAFKLFTKIDVLIQITDVKIPDPFIKGGFIGS